jgi:hypothetical protein
MVGNALHALTTWLSMRQGKVKHGLAKQGSGVVCTSDSVWDEHLEEDLPQLSSKMR